jgi:hypothetical protein
LANRRRRPGPAILTLSPIGPDTERPPRTVKPPLRVSVRAVGAAGGVIHAPGVPGAPPLRDILIDEVTCKNERASESESPRAWATRRHEGVWWQAAPGEWCNRPQRSWSSGVRLCAAALSGDGGAGGDWPAVSPRSAPSCVNAFTYPTGFRHHRWSAPSPGSPNTAVPSATTNGSPTTTRPWSPGR